MPSVKELFLTDFNLFVGDFIAPQGEDNIDEINIRKSTAILNNRQLL